MAPLSFLECDISPAAHMACRVRFCRIRAHFDLLAMVSRTSQIFFLEI